MGTPPPTRWPRAPTRSTTRSPRSSAPVDTRSRWSRTRHARGTWPSTRWHRRSRRATASSRRARSTRATRSRSSRPRSASGVVVDVIPDDEHGQLSVDALRAMLDERVRLIAISWIPTQGGLVNPAAAVGTVARDAGVPYLLDACQAAGQLPIDVDTLGCDFLSATGRKYLRGPAGHRPAVRAADARSRISNRRSSTSTPRAGSVTPTSRSGTTRAGSRAGSTASPTASGSAWRSTTRSRSGSTPSRHAWSSWRHRHAPCSPRSPGSRCTISASSVAASSRSPSTASTRHTLAARSRAQHINISVSTIDFARFDFAARGLDAVARASVHYYNTDDELERFVDAVAPAVIAARDDA